MGENYTYTFEKSNGFGLIVNSRFEFPLADWAGLSVGATLAYSQDHAFIGVGAGMLLGTLRSKDRQSPAR